MLVQVVRVQGSGPREPGAWMAVFGDGQVGTIGGGHLEWQAAARRLILTLQGEDVGRLRAVVPELSGWQLARALD